MFYSTGIKKYNIDKNNNSIHAEVDCIQNLKKTIKKKKVNLFVFRTNPMGKKLLMSKPCNSCINYINNNLYKKGYKLNNIYFINYYGEIEILK